MKAPVVLAQLSGPLTQTGVSLRGPRLEKPQDGQAVTLRPDGQTQFNFSDVAGEKLVFVRVGDRLVVLFDNQSTVTIDRVFDPSGHPSANVTFEMGPDRVLNGDQFAGLFPITTDPSVLPGAGGRNAHAHFDDPTVDQLSTFTALDLLGADNRGSSFGTSHQQTPNTSAVVRAVDVATIAEGSLANGNAGVSGHAAGPTTFTGSLHVNFGANATGRSFAFATDQASLTGLTSDALPVHLFVTITTAGLPELIGYVGTDPAIAANQAFTITLDANSTLEGTFTFTLLRPLDHPIQDANDTLNLSINVIAGDSSGIPANTTIHVNVIDDTPIVVAADETHSTLTDPRPHTFTSQTGSLGISWGADRFNDHANGGVSTIDGHTGDRSVVFTDATVTATGHAADNTTATLATLTSSGQAVHYALLDNGTVLLAYTGSVMPALPGTGPVTGDEGPQVSPHVVFVVSLSDASDSGSYVITQYQPLDHDSDAQTFDSIDLSFHFAATDSDGDSVSGTLTATVDDTGPSIGHSSVATVSEDGPMSVTGAPLAVDFGADSGNFAGSDRALAFTNAAVTATDPSGAAVALTSYGQAVSAELIGGVLVGYTGTTAPTTLTDASVVFTATLSSAGTYDFVLKQPLDHAAPVGSSDYLNLSFNITATDADGDTATGKFGVNVDAAGTIGSIDYNNETTGVFVNLGDAATSFGGQAVAAHSATDLASGGGHVIGIDALGTITDASGGSANDVIVGSSGASTIHGNGGNDTIIYNVGSTGVETVDGGAGTDTQIINGSGTAVTYNVNPITVGADNDIGINIVSGTGAGSTVAADASHYEVATKAVEEIVINLGNAGDHVVVSGDLSGTGLATSTITINGGAGDDTVDLSQFTPNEDVVFDGAGNGSGGDTVILGFASNAAGVSYSPILDGNGHLVGASITVQGANGPVTDTFTHIEHFQFTDGTLSVGQIFPPTANPVADAVADTAGSDAGRLLASGNAITDAGDSDIDAGTTLSVTAVNGSAAGVGSDVAGTYGTLHLDADGTYRYVAGTGLDALQASQNPSDVFHFTVTDSNGGATTTTLTVNVTGANDTAVISGPTTGSVVEAGGFNNATTNTPSASGTLTDIDADNPANTFQIVPTTASDSHYGTYTVDASGHWTYNLDNNTTTVQDLNVGDQLTDSFTVQTADGTPQVVTISIAGSNDAAVISGTTTGSVIEAGGANNSVSGTPTAVGTLTDTDADNPANTFQIVPTTASDSHYGTYTVDASGHWTYNLDNANATVQGLNAGGQLTDSFTVQTADGTPQVVTISIAGSNDAAVISGTTTGSVTEAGGANNSVSGTPTASGTLTDTDVDNPANTFQAVTTLTTSTGGYGSFTVDASGHWTYNLDNANAAVQGLNVGGQLTDGFTVQTADGTSQIVSISIAGSNDAAVISGTTTGSVTEAGGANNSVSGTPTASGTLTDIDADNPANTFQIVPTTASDSHYGTYTVDASGHWTYHLDNTNAAVQGLNAGGQLTDSFTVQTADGTPQVVTISIAGSNDAAVISGTTTGSVTEAGGANNSVSGTPTASGTLTDTDVDNPGNTFQAVATLTASAGGYGTYTVDASGHWTYHLDNTNVAVQALANGQLLSDSFAVQTQDGTSQTVTIQITGANDAATFGGTDTGAVTEAGGVNNASLGVATAGGTLIVSDVDSSPAVLPENNIATSYGHFTIGANGAWSYTLDDNNPTVQALNTTSAPLQDAMTVTTVDGTTHQITVAIHGADDAAVNTVPTSQTVSNAATLTFSAANGDAISVADVDNTTLTETLTVSHGALTLHGVSGLNFTAGDGTADQTMTFSGSQSDINAALNGLVYTPTSGYAGTDSLQIGSNDGALNTPSSVAINVTQSNHAPVAVNDTYTGSVTTTPPGSGWTFDAANGHYYKVFGGNFSWSAADTAAHNAGGYLATVTSAAENTFIVNLDNHTAAAQYLWIGASDAATEGTWKWVEGPETGTTFWQGDSSGSSVGGGYSNWNVGEPNNGVGYNSGEDYANIQAVFSGAWNDATGSAAANGDVSDYVGYVVEFGGAVSAPTENVPVVIAASSLLANDSDPDAGDTFSITSVQNATHGTVSLSGDHQTITFTPDANYSGAADFTYTITDSHGATSTATVSLNLAFVDQPPVAMADTVNVNEDATASTVSRGAGVLANDTDPDTGDTATLVVSSVLAGTSGTASGVTGTTATVVHGIYGDLTMHADGTYSYTPNNASAEALAQNATADDIFTYTAQDTSGQTSSTTLTFHITGQDDAPVNGVPGAQTVGLNSSLVFSTTNNDAISVSDVDNGTLTVMLSASHGALTLHQLTGLGFSAGDGTADASMTFTGTVSAINAALNGLTYAPTSGYSGSDAVQITTGDGTLNDTDTVAITVQAAPANHAPDITSAAPTPTVVEDASYYATTSSGNMLLNGGFDYYNGSFYTLQAWTVTGSVTVYGGYQSGGSAGLNPSSSLGQSIATVAGTTYSIDFYALNGGDVTVSENGVSVGSFSQSINDWVHYTYQFVATSANTAIQFSTDSSGYLDVDQIAVQPVSTVTPGQEAATGTITFTDADHADTHTVTQAAPTFSLIGGTLNQTQINALTSASSLTLTEHDGSGSGSVDWAYQISDSAIQFLTNGQTLTETYAVTVTDNHGAATSQSVTITINGSAPAVTSEAITGAGGIKNHTLNAGDTVTVTVNMNETVNVTGTPQLNLVIGTTTVQANYASGSGSSSLVFTYQIQSGQTDSNGISIGSLNLTNGATIVDLGGRAAVLTASAADDSNYMVDTTKPTVSGSTVTSSHTGSSNNTTETAIFTVTFSEAVTGVTKSAFTATDSTGNWSISSVTGGTNNIYTVTATGTGKSTIVGTALTLGLAGNVVSDLAGNLASSNTNIARFNSLAPAGASGEAINLALTDHSDHTGMVSLTISGLAAGWSVSDGTHNADGSWSVLTSDLGSLTVTSPDGYVGALVANVSESWTNADGTIGNAFIADNVEAYAKGAPIFAWSGDDTLTASGGNDTLVFANKIGTDVVHHFDAAHDQIDLIGFAGVSSFADVQAHLANDGNGNAKLTLGDGETITLVGVDAGSLNAGDFVFDQTPVTHNSGTMAISDGALLPISGTVDNTGAIQLGSAGSETDLEIVQHGATLQGGGTLTLSDNAENVIFGSDSSVALTNVDNTISGAGQLGYGQMTLVNEGTIVATGSNALLIDTGDNAIVNTGTLEATGSGGLVVHSDIANNGTLWANGGAVTLDNDVSGSGSARISGHGSLEIGGAFGQQVSFDDNAGGTLKLDHPDAFGGMLSGFGEHDAIDLAGILGASASLNYVENAQGTGGVLSVTDGAHTANIAFIGQYTTADFHVAADGSGAVNHALVQMEHQVQQLAAAA